MSEPELGHSFCRVEGCDNRNLYLRDVCPEHSRPEPVYWISPVGVVDDFGDKIEDEIIDGRTIFGPWALMTPKSWEANTGTRGRLGTGYGQRFKKQEDGRWLKIEG